MSRKESSSIVGSFASSPGSSATLTLKYTRKALSTASFSTRSESGVLGYADCTAVMKSAKFT
jgi:hypothetical protein